ncbi:DUF6691 family protein [Roseateles sp. P5_E7]
MKHIVVAAIAGLVFGLGLIVSGMVFPAKVLGFLDLAGAWDPSLALVMAGAIAVGLPAFAWARRAKLKLPDSTRIDRRLVGGSLLFGIGWGLAGLCPGPALVLAGLGDAKALGFVAAMLVGMAIFEALEHRKR